MSKTTPAPPQVERHPSGLPKRYSNFAVEFYPDRLEHMDMLKYLENHSHLFRIVYILHDKDVWTQDDVNEIIEKKSKGEYEKDVPVVGSLKDPHIHCLVHCNETYTVSSFVKFFGVWINYALPIDKATTYICYMLHDTPNSIHKYQYPASELKGDKKLISKATGQNLHFVQLAEINTIIQNSNDGTLSELIDNVSGLDEEEIKEIFETISSYQSLICCLTNQESRKRQNQHLFERLLEQEKIVRELSFRMSKFEYSNDISDSIKKVGVSNVLS